MIAVEVVRACEKLYSAEMYQSWLWSVLGIAKRRGGAMLGSGELQGITVYRDLVGILVGYFGGPGVAEARSIGERRVLRMITAFEETEFVVGLMRGMTRGVETWVGVSQALALVELRRATQPVMDAMLQLVRAQQELPLSERGGEAAAHLEGSAAGETGTGQTKGGEADGKL